MNAPASPVRFPRRPRDWLLLALLLSALPALLLFADRWRFESQPAAREYLLVMDYPALAEQAAREGEEPLTLLRAYRERGVSGAAVYQDTLLTLQARGEVTLLRGSEAQALFPEGDFRASWHYAASRAPGAAEDFAAALELPVHRVSAGGRGWLGFGLAPGDLPGGAPLELIARLRAEGLTVVYRPLAQPALRDPVGALPAVPYIAFAGAALPAAGEDGGAALLAERLGNRVPALIEGAEQVGMAALLRERGGAGGVRMFSLAADWQATLPPQETASKYVLAARERGHRLLYLRPYAESAHTETMLNTMRAGLDRAGLSPGEPQPRLYRPSEVLRALSLAGPLLALALLALSVPLRALGVLAALGTLGLALLVNGFALHPALALVSAVTFPALGLALWRRRVRAFLLATGISLLGVLFVSALGSTPESMLGLHPFRGVGLTLLLPLALFALTILPRGDPRAWVGALFRRPLTVGDLALAGVALVVVAVVLLRRGNDPLIGVTDAESGLRTALQDNVIRPRFKDMLTHPLALLGLSGALPRGFSELLLLGGVIGQASILNTFAHFHTPLSISAQRVFNGLLVGVLLGLLLIVLARLALRWWRGAPAAAAAPHKETA